MKTATVEAHCPPSLSSRHQWIDAADAITTASSISTSANRLDIRTTKHTIHGFVLFFVFSHLK
ncbi:hypothetical protein BVRB_2g030680 [Beta vulgaris subsp. vulgaris]|nr:hypothetical protein BVRB_2g030680 [Beta vulgaris subsp. vulgaris]